MPQLEEIEDIDNMDFDLAEFDPTLRTPVAPKLEKTVVRSQDHNYDHHLDHQQVQHQHQHQHHQQHHHFQGEELAQLKTLQLLYPAYFDSQRSHSQGRRVPLELASVNPMAQTIADACVALNVQCVLEPEKTHPQDYGNPGRVRVVLQEHSTKRHLMKRVAEYLQSHPADLKSLMKGSLVPEEFKSFEPKEIPLVKGFKMNSIVPVYSRYTLEHPMTKSIYEARPELPEAKDSIKAKDKTPKNKYRPMRR